MSELALSAEAISTLHEGRQAYVAVGAQRGPHVTPELYAWSGGQLWFAAATSTVKAKVLVRRPRASAAVVVGERSVLLAGSAEVLDPTKPHRLSGQLRRFPDAAAAMARFAARNAPDLLAFVGDTVSGKLGRHLPPARVAVGLVPDAAAVVEGGRVTEAWGAWAALAEADHAGAATAEASTSGDPVVAALPGPVAVPALWRSDDSELQVPAALLAHLELQGTFPLSFVGDEYHRPGPAAKEGVLLRGTGQVGEVPGSIRVDADQVVAWDGVDTESEDL